MQPGIRAGSAQGTLNYSSLFTPFATIFNSFDRRDLDKIRKWIALSLKLGKVWSDYSPLLLSFMKSVIGETERGKNSFFCKVHFAYIIIFEVHVIVIKDHLKLWETVWWPLRRHEVLLLLLTRCFLQYNSAVSVTKFPKIYIGLIKV